MSVTIVVPCYNEESRLRVADFDSFLRATPEARFVVVNDGSTDGTLDLLRSFAERWPDRCEVVDLQPNGGKAEAVRAGLSIAIGAVPPPDVVGYFDADLATPLRALPDMLSTFEEHPHVDIVLASRVQLLGRSIERRRLRHYAGRVFATAASAVLALPVYDTQCGAKLFRVLPSFVQSLSEPFIAGWAFDVELLRRLQIGRSAFGELPVEESTYEFPLDRWRDVRGSKVRARDFPVALIELGRIYTKYRGE